MGKGSQFERDICVQLSLWWSDGKDEDIFWRTAGSGARATARKKKGKKTYGNDGDIQAVNPIGKPLMKVCNIELKRGYSKDTIFDIIDKPAKNKPSTYANFINQTLEENENSGAKYWMLITRRDRREPVVFIPKPFIKELQNYSLPYITMYIKMYLTDYVIYGLRLNEFLQKVKPEYIKDIYDRLRKKV